MPSAGINQVVWLKLPGVSPILYRHMIMGPGLAFHKGRGAGRATGRGPGGFTLVELMIVVAIVGLLSAIAVPAFLRAGQTAQNNRFASDVRIARDAFLMYAQEHGTYPPDTMPGVMPQGMSEYLSKVHWDQPTAIGGQWDWDNGQFGTLAGVSVYQPDASRAQVKRIDAVIDDGDLSTGTFRARSSGYISIIE